MKAIQDKVGAFFQEAEDSCENPVDRVLFMQLIASAVGIFFHNNYKKDGHIEMAEFFKSGILKTAKSVSESNDSTPHIHFVINIQKNEK